CGMAACTLPFLHPARLGRRGVRARVPARFLGCWVLRDAAARASARFRGRGMLVAAPLDQWFVSTPLEMGEVAMRSRNQPPTKPTKFAVEFWDQIRAGRDIEEAAKALGASITTCRNWFRHRGGVKPP